MQADTIEEGSSQLVPETPPPAEEGDATITALEQDVSMQDAQETEGLVLSDTQPSTADGQTEERKDQEMGEDEVETALVFDHISPPRIALAEYKYHKLPPIPFHLPTSNGSASNDAEEGDAKSEKGTEVGKKMKRIVGHEMKRNSMWYYVELGDGRVERKPAGEMEGEGRLLRTYEMQSRNGKLKSFDAKTDPRLRPLKITIDMRRTLPEGSRERSPSWEGEDDAASAAATSAKEPAAVRRVYDPDEGFTTPPDTTEDEDEGESEVDELDEDDVEITGRRTRSSARAAAAALKGGAKRKAPSPKKTRAKVREMRARGQTELEKVEEEDEEEDEDEGESEIWTEPPESDDDDEDDYVGGRGKRSRSGSTKAKGKKAALTGRRMPVLELGAIYEYQKGSFSEEKLAELDPLHAHRDTCRRCHQKPAHLLRKRGGKRRQRGKYEDGDVDDRDDEVDPDELGGWLKCTKCCLAAHWDCISLGQRLEVMRAVRQSSGNEFWQGLPRGQASAFVCGSCTKGGECLGCGEMLPDGSELWKEKEPKESEKVEEKKTGSVEATSKKSTPAPATAAEGKDVNPPQAEPASIPENTESQDQSVEAMQVDEVKKEAKKPATKSPEMDETPIFRCSRCKRAAHYRCLPNPPRKLALQNKSPLSLEDLARHYNEKWECDQCDRWSFPVELVLAWRAAPGVDEVKEAARKHVNYKAPLKREYLVKWERRSFARVEWVPHAWLTEVSGAKLKNFLEGGRKVELLAEGGTVAFETSSAGRPGPEPGAGERIPEAWRRVDRLLDVKFWKPQKTKADKKKAAALAKAKALKGRRNAVTSETEGEDSEDPIELFEPVEEEDPRIRLLRDGEEPDEDLLENAETRIARLKRTKAPVTQLGEADLKDLAWCYIKWEDLGYEQSTWDTPYPREGLPFPGMANAFRIFLQGREIAHGRLTRKELEEFDEAARKDAKPVELTEQPEFAKGGQLFPFQLQGVSWLWLQWWQKRGAILADEMGLGKTVQVITFLNLLYTRLEISPFLVVVPNSTIVNWTREFARWAPNMHVTPYFGEAAARKIIRSYELFENGRAGRPQTRGKQDLKTDVIITTYETVVNANKDATERSVFNSVPRWEVMVVDESQKLKNDEALIFKRLSEMSAAHRVLMTGTPLNNNIRELFNLMNFLDRDNWNDLERLEQEYEELDEEKIKKLHNELKPYFLRRIKEEELDLPARNEVIVPVSMSTLQKEVYRGLLARNAELIGQLVGNISGSTAKTAVIKKGTLNNLLMELRKCLQHPYLVNRDLEPQDLSEEELHRIFVAASAKLVLLQGMLRQLKERGHRVLLFSQFVIALDIIEDFLVEEGYKFLRLDGHTKHSERQKGMDQFNKEGSDYFIYLLSTRAGGVGINLTAADTVIVFDPDFNPHMDHQAIARAHRIGQTRPVLVFKLMVKDSAEEKIVQVGKKKLILDHLIVQKMDVDDEGLNDIQTILSFGAKALFEEEAGKAMQDLTYSDQAILDLITKTENDGKTLTEQKADRTNNKKGLTFDFAKVWEASKGGLEELPDDTPAENQVSQLQDFWATVAKRATAEEAERQSKILLGRGGRRAAAASLQDQSKEQRKKKRDADKVEEEPPRAGDSDAEEGSDFVAPSEESASEDDDDEVVAMEGLELLDEMDAYLPTPEKKKRVREKKTLSVTLPPSTLAPGPRVITQPRYGPPLPASFGLTPGAAPLSSMNRVQVFPGQARVNATAQANGAAAPGSAQLTSQLLGSLNISAAVRVPSSIASHPNYHSAQNTAIPSNSTTVPAQPQTARWQPVQTSYPAQPQGSGPKAAPNPVQPKTSHTKHRPSSTQSAGQSAAAQLQVSSSTPKRPLEPDSDDEELEVESQIRPPCPFCDEVHVAGDCAKLKDVSALEAVKDRILASNEEDEDKVPALAAIDELLRAAYAQRDKNARAALAARQAPTASTSRSPVKVGPPQKKRKSSNHTYPTTPTTIPANQNIPPTQQRIGAATLEKCPLCNGAMHPPAQCLSLASSPVAIKRAITKLLSDSKYSILVEQLKVLLQKRHNITYSDSPSRSGSRAGIQAIPVNAPVQALQGAAIGGRRSGINSIPVNAPMQTMQNTSNPTRRSGIQALPVSAPMQKLGSSPTKSGSSSRVSSADGTPSGPRKPVYRPPEYRSPNTPTSPDCLICQRNGHKSKDCALLQFMTDAQLKSTYNALKRPPAYYNQEEVGLAMNVLWHRRGELKGIERAKKRAGNAPQSAASASAPSVSTRPQPEVIELSD